MVSAETAETAATTRQRRDDAMIPLAFREQLDFFVGEARVPLELVVPRGADGLVVVAHGDRDTSTSRANRALLERFCDDGLATLAVGAPENPDSHEPFGVPALTKRLGEITDHAPSVAPAPVRQLPVGYFATGPAAAAALLAASVRPGRLRTVVTLDALPHVGEEALAHVLPPALMFVGELDRPKVELHRTAFADIPAPKRLHTVPGADDLFETPEAMDVVGHLASNWFGRHFPAPV